MAFFSIWQIRIADSPSFLPTWAKVITVYRSIGTAAFLLGKLHLHVLWAVIGHAKPLQVVWTIAASNISALLVVHLTNLPGSLFAALLAPALIASVNLRAPAAAVSTFEILVAVKRDERVLVEERRRAVARKPGRPAKGAGCFIIAFGGSAHSYLAAPRPGINRRRNSHV